MIALTGGCVGAPSDFHPQASTSTSPDAFPALQVAWERCTGNVAATEADRDDVRAIVPAEFNLRGQTPLTASLIIENLHCERVSVLGIVFENVDVFDVVARVDPVNENWSNGRPSHYVIHFVVASPDFGDQVRGMGMDARPANKSETTVEPQATFPAYHLVTMTGGDFQLDFDYVTQKGTQDDFAVDYHLWLAAFNGFLRADVHKIYSYDGPLVVPGLLRVEGTTPIDPVLVNGVLPYSGQSYENLDETWLFEPQIFR